jgi:hypothetical protein
MRRINGIFTPINEFGSANNRITIEIGGARLATRRPGRLPRCRGYPDTDRKYQLTMDLAQRAKLLGQLSQGGLVRTLDRNRGVLENGGYPVRLLGFLPHHDHPLSQCTTLKRLARRFGTVKFCIRDQINVSVLTKRRKYQTHPLGLLRRQKAPTRATTRTTAQRAPSSLDRMISG